MNPTRCYTIPAELSFLDTLAGWILSQYGHDPALLAKSLVLLPNRRACRSLRDMFLVKTGGKPILLPRMQPIGEALGEEAFFTGSAALPEPISALRRQLLLTRLVADFEKTRGRTNMVQAAGPRPPARQAHRRSRARRRRFREPGKTCA